mgnify:CR=1 FL=1
MANRYATALLLGLLIAPVQSGFSGAQDALQAPEAATGITEKAASTATRHMVAAAHPLAAEAGREMLRKGGSAADAAIATQLVLGLVEPQSSGLGGGAFLLHWDAQTKLITTYDGRERAPLATTPDHFPAGAAFENLVPTGLSIGVPGLPRLVGQVHARHGKRPLAELLAPEIGRAHV